MKTKAVICYYLKDKKTLNLLGERNNTKDRGFWGTKKLDFGLWGI